MPSGYTAGVQDGTITDFRDYAMKCARAFGALIMMRDDPMDAEIPEEFQPSTYNAERVAESRAELAKLESCSEEEAQAMADADHAKKVEYRLEALERKRIERKRYESMLEKARAYIPPTEDHSKYAEFLVSQLEESIKWDCDESYYEAEPVRLDGHTWKMQRMQSLREDIKRNLERQQEENERTDSRNRWIAELRKSLTAGDA